MTRLIPLHVFHKLMENHWAAFYLEEYEHMPVIKLFSENVNCTWILSDINHENQNMAYGLVDSGDGFPRMEDVEISYLENIEDVKMDESFNPLYTIYTYEEAAKMCGKITEDDSDLRKAKLLLLQKHTHRQ